MRRRRSGRSPLAVGAIALAIISALVYLGFTKDVPFIGKPFEVKATFQSANSIRPNSPVRIAGVNVGKVSRVEPQEGGNGAVVVMSLQDQGLPIHEDATVKIRPRIFLEGNFFVDLKPGSPGAPVLDNGDTIKVTQTATPVQLDEVLTTLQEDTREDLQDTLDAFARALTEKPTAAQDRRNDPATRGETAAESFNDTYEDAPGALRATSVINEAFLGTQPEQDVGRLIEGGAKTFEALGRDERALQDLVTNFNRTLAAFAAEETSLRASIRQLGPTLETANRALGSLNSSFPATRAFAREILPGVRETPATIEASFPWITQMRGLLSRAELGGLANDLSPATRDLARLIDRLDVLLPQTDLAAKCASRVILPTGDVVIEDDFSNGVANYKEFWYAMVGLAGEGANFDGNGPYVRFQPGGGSQTVSLGEAGGSSELLGNLAAVPLGSQPRYPGERPPYVSDQPCFEQGIPDLNGPAAQKGPPDRLVSGGGATAQTRAARELERRTLTEKLRPFGTPEPAAAGTSATPAPQATPEQSVRAVREVVRGLQDTFGAFDIGGGR